MEAHRELLQTAEDSRSQQMFKSERKDETFFLHDITHLMYHVVYDGFKIHGF